VIFWGNWTVGLREKEGGLGRVSRLKDLTYKEHPPKSVHAKMKATQIGNNLVLLNGELYLDPV